MAKKSAVARNKQRAQLVKRMKTLRDKWRHLIKKAPEQREEALIKLQKQSRNASPIRIRRRCESCGRPHGVLRKFALCRLCLRKALMHGDVPGATKASW